MFTLIPCVFAEQTCRVCRKKFPLRELVAITGPAGQLLAWECKEDHDAAQSE